jgi:hypothetical protein
MRLYWEVRKMKKLIGILIILTLIFVGTICNVVPAKNLEYFKTRNNNSQIDISGSISSLGPKTDIILYDGNSSQIEKIERILNNRIMQIIPPYIRIIECTGLGFSVNFTQDAKDLGFFGFWYFHYSTSIYEKGTPYWKRDRIVRKSHTVEVKGFNGLFLFMRPRLITPEPSHFAFMGEYEEVTIIQ